MQMKVTAPSITVAEAPFWNRSSADVGPSTVTSSRSPERWIASTASDQNRAALGGPADGEGVGDGLGEDDGVEDGLGDGDGVGPGVGVGVGVGTTVGPDVPGGGVDRSGGAVVSVDGEAVVEVQPASRMAARIVVTRRTTTA